MRSDEGENGDGDVDDQERDFEPMEQQAEVYADAHAAQIDAQEEVPTDKLDYSGHTDPNANGPKGVRDPLEDRP